MPLITPVMLFIDRPVGSVGDTDQELTRIPLVSGTRDVIATLLFVVIGLAGYEKLGATGFTAISTCVVPTPVEFVARIV